MTQTAINVNSAAYRLDTPHTPATLATLIRAKQARIAAIEGWASAATMGRERTELAKLEAQS